MVDVTHCNYEGIAWTNPDDKPDCSVNSLVRIHISSRIILDYATHGQANMSQATGFSFSAARLIKRRHDHDSDASSQSTISEPERSTRFDLRPNDKSHEMTNDQALLCPARIRGFSLADKKWAFFLVDSVTEIEWLKDPMDRLEINAESKKIIDALVTAHEHRQSTVNAQFQDVIPGKGMGLAFLFAGAPGLGKTLTAEIVSEYRKKALYSITSGELRTDTVAADNRTRMIFSRAKAWDAYLLLDEADVFLAERTQDGDLARNGLVTVFLRLIEHYEGNFLPSLMTITKLTFLAGVIFLTMNRLTTFDPAFGSRIQFKLFYDPLTPDQRANIWRSLLPRRRVSQSDPVGELGWDDKVLQALGRDFEINGREIKNMIITAHALAEAANETLDEKHLDIVMKINDRWMTKAKENAKRDTRENDKQDSNRDAKAVTEIEVEIDAKDKARDDKNALA